MKNNFFCKALSKRLEKLEEENSFLRKKHENSWSVKEKKLKKELSLMKMENEELRTKIVILINLFILLFNYFNF